MDGEGGETQSIPATVVAEKLDKASEKMPRLVNNTLAHNKRVLSTRSTVIAGQDGGEDQTLKDIATASDGSLKETDGSFPIDGPKFIDILHDSVDRENTLSSRVVSPPTIESWRWGETPDRDVARNFTEREGLEDLDRFLETTIATAKNTGNKEILDTAIFIRDNLVYIGEHELQEAISGMAERAINVVLSGQDVFVASFGHRSERYLSLRALEELDRITEGNQELRKHIHFSDYGEEIAKKLKSLDGKGKIIIPDDFAVSGTRIRGFAGIMFGALIEQGYSPEQAIALIEIDVVADVDRSNYVKNNKHHLSGKLDNGEKYEEELDVFSYYRINSPRKPEGGQYIIGGAMTGSHASVDYGFEMPMEEFQEFLFNNGIKLQNPLLTRINRPYDFDSRPGSRTYEDPKLQQRWEELTARYRLIPNSENL